MTDPTNPGDIQVWGQRRLPGGGFPTAGGAGVPLPLNIPNIERRDPESPYYDPCALSATRQMWNADAAAIGQITAMLAAAAAESPGGDFSNHEVVVTLYRDAAGVVRGTPPIVGPRVDPNCVPTSTVPCVAGVQPGTWAYVNHGNWMGEIHSHPWNAYWSSGDRNGHLALTTTIRTNFPGRTEQSAGLATYITVVDPNSPTGYSTYAHTDSTGEGVVGREVNPNAQPCPSV